jgi:hypothetical protein
MNMTDTRPCVAPISGHYAEQRGGNIVFYTADYSERLITWDANGKARDMLDPELSSQSDFVATFPPEHLKAMTDNPALMSALADGRVGAWLKTTKAFQASVVMAQDQGWDLDPIIYKKMIDAFTAIQGSAP